jgi:hypothetical protein
MTLNFDTIQSRIEDACEEAVPSSSASPDPTQGEVSGPYWLVNMQGARPTRKAKGQTEYLVTVELILVRGGADSDLGGTMYRQLLSDGATVLQYFETNLSLILTTQSRSNLIAGMQPGTVRCNWDGTGLVPTVDLDGNDRPMRGTRYILTFNVLNIITNLNV